MTTRVEFDAAVAWLAQRGMTRLGWRRGHLTGRGHYRTTLRAADWQVVALTQIALSGSPSSLSESQRLRVRETRLARFARAEVGGRWWLTKAGRAELVRITFEVDGRLGPRAAWLTAGVPA